ncbi:hypothetical protein GJ496_006588 [Pomphorhynchus laevis]|nr:hypothetical protein GJ496_008706 [Pomphorhynchus laevis]KAI0985546.1 hypothetical protein GJ496_006588 [Pomphorhynchus laevis]
MKILQTLSKKRQSEKTTLIGLKNENKRLLKLRDSLILQLKLLDQNRILQLTLYIHQIVRALMKHEIRIEIDYDDICDLAKTLINLCSDANTTGTDHITLDCPASLRSCLEQLCCPWTQTEIVDQTNVDNEGEQSLNKDFKVNENLRNRCCLSDGSSTRLDQLLKQLMIHRDRMNSKLNLSLDQGRILS